MNTRPWSVGATLILAVLTVTGASAEEPKVKELVRGPEATAAAEASVREWRERREPHLPTFPSSTIDELHGTIPYPPEGSPSADGSSNT